MNFSDLPDIEKLNKSNNECCFSLTSLSSGNYLFTKTCCRQDKFPAYDYSFRREYNYMKNLEQSFPGCYQRYFPHYVSYTLSSLCNRPQIVMEAVHGISLEEILRNSAPRNNTRPYQLLPPSVMAHICQQIYEALVCLYQGGMLYFDLLPENIIVVNQQFDIRLIDFTFCFHLGEAHPFGYKILDSQLDQTIPLPAQPVKAMMLFCTRLFFAGKDAYRNYYRQASLFGAFFRDNYGCLFASLCAEPEDDYIIADAYALLENDSYNHLEILRGWYERLMRKLKRLSSRP